MYPKPIIKVMITKNNHSKANHLFYQQIIKEIQEMDPDWNIKMYGNAQNMYCDSPEVVCWLIIRVNRSQIYSQNITESNYSIDILKNLIDAEIQYQR